MSKLRVKNGDLQSIPEYFFFLYLCEHYHSLHLDFGNLQVIGKHDLDQFVNLKCLTIIANQLTVLHGKCFRRLVQLETIDLKANQLTVIPMELFWELCLLRNVKLIAPSADGLVSELFKYT